MWAPFPLVQKLVQTHTFMLYLLTFPFCFSSSFQKYFPRRLNAEKASVRQFPSRLTTRVPSADKWPQGLQVRLCILLETSPETVQETFPFPLNLTGILDVFLLIPFKKILRFGFISLVQRLADIVFSCSFKMLSVPFSKKVL